MTGVQTCALPIYLRQNSGAIDKGAWLTTITSGASSGTVFTVGDANYFMNGWGMIPVHVRIGKTEWVTSLFPKDGCYIVPIKASVRKAENLGEGDMVTMRLEVRL